MTSKSTPSSLGYHFPSEFAKHDATWLSWPHKEASWPGTISRIFPYYSRFIKEIAKHERVCINVTDQAMREFALQNIMDAGADLSKISFHFNPTNDAWCRDHGPAFLINPSAQQKKIIVDWNYNAWGNKYPPYDLDDVVPSLIGKEFNLPVFHPGIVMEGGSVEFNGKGTVLTSESCLLNPNRNPNLDRADIERYLLDYYCVQQVLWVPDGIVGDDTDGHIDDTIRFVNDETVLAVVEYKKNDENYELLQDNLKALNKMRLLNGKHLNIIELPMPDAVVYEDQRLPASYANFYITNGSVIVPTYRCDKDDKALQTIAECFPDRDIIGIDSTEIIWGLGSFHCLSQQEPTV
ncbi:MAG: agmatine deiminase family protein [Chitinophagaceae bacterium]|nr:agmatine deiminase family protein [Chitinophagaceae bacterium]